MHDLVIVTGSESLVQTYTTRSGDELTFDIYWDGQFWMQQILWNDESSALIYAGGEINDGMT